MKRYLGCVALTAGLMASPAHAMCFAEAGKKYNINPALLRAIAQVESSMNPSAMNLSHQARTGSYDIGLMQINSRWLPVLKRYEINESALKDACTSIMVGAWILADTMKRHGGNWNGVGAYNAACTQLKGDDCEQARFTYASKVWRAMNRFEKAESGTLSAQRQQGQPKDEKEGGRGRSLIASVSIEIPENTAEETSNE
jgi:hypothetical protein